MEPLYSTLWAITSNHVSIRFSPLTKTPDFSISVIRISTYKGGLYIITTCGGSQCTFSTYRSRGGLYTISTYKGVLCSISTCGGGQCIITVIVEAVCVLLIFAATVCLLNHLPTSSGNIASLMNGSASLIALSTKSVSIVAEKIFNLASYFNFASFSTQNGNWSNGCWW